MHAGTLSPRRRDCTEVTPRSSAWQLAFLNHPLTAGLAAQTKDRQEEAARRRRGRARLMRWARISRKITQMKWKYRDGQTILLSVSALITTLSGQMSVCFFFSSVVVVVLTRYRDVDASHNIETAELSVLINYASRSPSLSQPEVRGRSKRSPEHIGYTPLATRLAETCGVVCTYLKLLWHMRSRKKPKWNKEK